jgi:hypothetical protein
MGHRATRIISRCLLALGMAACALGSAAQTAPAASAAPRAGVATVVAGILGYTRWPAEGSTLRLCTLGRGPAVDELLSATTDLGSSQRRVAVQALANPAQMRAACDAVYVADSGAAAAREALLALAGQPVLMLGEGAGFCSDGGMFCLEPGEGSTRFGANLDAIARSGLRVNPMVLRIARGARP